MNFKKTGFFIRGIIASGAILCLSSIGFAQDAERPYSQWTWNDALLRSVFDQLSKVGGTDIVVDPGVIGKVTLSVTNKGWKDVFDIVCRMNQLEAIQESNYVYVMTSADYQAQLARKELGKQGLAELQELVREVIKLSNTNAREMEVPVRDLISSRGKITVVEHTNSLIVYDTKTNIEKIRSLVNRLDIEVEQISISAKIIEVGSGFKRDLGVQWLVNSTGSTASGGVAHLPTKTPGSGIITSALERATFGIMGQTSFDIALEALLQDSKNEVIAQPQITTLDNKTARIFMGNQVPVTYQDDARNTLVKMIDAGTELIVLPHLTSEGRIMLDLKPTKKSYTFSATGQPIISEQSASTNVVVSDGETVVIAGLSSNEDQKTEGGIPFLKDIPIIGNLFKKSSKTNDKRDLIIFVTPHIIKRSMEAPVAPADSSLSGTASGSGTSVTGYETTIGQ